VAATKRYKFQALVRLHPAGDDGTCTELGPSPRRMVLRTEAGHDQHELSRYGKIQYTQQSKMFVALVSKDDEEPVCPGSSRFMVTLRISGDNVCDYLGIGGRFHLWLGGDVADGIISRRLFV
jgi:hypothetical protein